MNDSYKDLAEIFEVFGAHSEFLFYVRKDIFWSRRTAESINRMKWILSIETPSAILPWDWKV